jgi:hypothetical protein
LALLEIGLTIPVLVTATKGAQISLSRGEIEMAFDSGYCHPLAWVEEYVALRRRWLTEDAARWIIHGQASQLETSLEPFPDRVAHYAKLAAFAALQGFVDEARSFVHLSASNLLAHGYHKDMLFNEVLDMLEIYSQSCQKNGFWDDVSSQLKNHLLLLAPAIAAIDKYTDGDETGHLPRTLAEVLAAVEPEWLPLYYQWLSSIDEYYDAIHTFHTYLRTADLSCQQSIRL